MSLFKTLEEITQIPGISGREEKVREYIISRIKGKCQYDIDSLGNIIAFKEGKKRPKNKLFFSAHMDEVGFVVTGVTDEGFLNFTTVGGIDNRVIFGKAVQVGENLIPGIIAGKPIHLSDSNDLESAPDPDKIVVDIGAKDKEDALKHVQLGDYIIYHGPYMQMGDKTIVAKAFDDRAGCAMLLDIIDGDIEYDCTFGFTVQEEIGCVGGETAAYQVNADIGVVVESTTASDIGGVKKDRHVCSQGKGPVISFMDRGAIYDTGLYNYTMETAKNNGIPCQPKAGVFGGNEARVIQTARAGARILAVSLPTRYLHSPSNTLNTDDVENTRKLLEILIKELAEYKA